MTDRRLEEVFKISGVPAFTFVKPTEYNDLKVALRTAGRGVIVEGPSGIGKSTAVSKALQELDHPLAVTRLSARIPSDVEYIGLLPELNGFGLVVVDDFHRLPEEIRDQLADLLKTLADLETSDSKLVVIGINQAGYSLIQHAPDLVNRIDTIKFEVEPECKIEELIRRGEEALNIKITATESIMQGSAGSFYVAQLLCHAMCLEANVLHARQDTVQIDILYTTVKRKVLTRQEARFGKPTKDFARGTRFRPSGRAPYLHILRWLSESVNWSIKLRDEIARHPQERISVSQVVEKGYLENLTRQDRIAEMLHFNPSSRVLSVEDPLFMFYLRNTDWTMFVKDVGFTKIDFSEPFDVALSFAGEDRAIAEYLRDHLEDLGHTVFYDLAEQHRIIANNVEEYLGPIYSSDCRYVVALLGPKYGQKRWTLFESDQYRDRIRRGQVIPIWSKDAPANAFDQTRDIGGLQFDPNGDFRVQSEKFSQIISRKLEDDESY